MLPARALALQNTINKALKSDVVILGSAINVENRFTSGSLSLDVALGGGWPANVWCEVVGKFSAGKTALVNKTLAANMADNPHFTALWVAAEAYDKDQASALGVDMDRLLVCPVQDMATAFEIMLEAASSRGVDAIVLDSYPALVTDDEAEKSMSEMTVASGARMMNKFIRKAGAVSSRALDGEDTPFLAIIINQYRDKIGGFAPHGIVPQTTPGGKGKDYFFYTRLEVARDDWIEEKRPNVSDPVKVGQTLRIRTIKNKAAAPMQTATVDYYFRRAPYLGFGRGDYDFAKEYVNTGILFGVVKKGGAWLRFRDMQWQGKDKMIAAVREDHVLKSELSAEVLEIAGDPLLADRRLDGTP